LLQGAWANHYAVQRPGLANFFFDSASEEREHGLKLLGYLRMRGHNDLDILPSSLVYICHLSLPPTTHPSLSRVS
jgi:ferritin heavy chain